jgi:hypothetical protein
LSDYAGCFFDSHNPGDTRASISKVTKGGNTYNLTQRIKEWATGVPGIYVDVGDNRTLLHFAHYSCRHNFSLI